MNRSRGRCLALLGGFSAAVVVPNLTRLVGRLHRFVMREPLAGERRNQRHDTRIRLMHRCIALLLAVGGVLALAVPAAGKQVSAAKVCGTGGCRTIDRPTAQLLMGGPPTSDPPGAACRIARQAAPWVRRVVLDLRRLAWDASRVRP
jgi:hypothetical protein